MYHYVRDASLTGLPAIRALPPVLFERQLDWLQEHYTVVTPTRFEQALDGEATLPPNAALLTFDDGFVDHYETVFPILRARGLRGVFFVSYAASGPSPRLLGVHKTHVLLAALGAEVFGREVMAECRTAGNGAGSESTVFGIDRWDEAGERAIKHLLNYELPFDEAERILDTVFRRHLGDPSAMARTAYLNSRTIEEMARGGMTFGYHTRTHRMLSRLPRQQQVEELRDGVPWIHSMTAQSRVPFCYPWGGPQTYTADTVRILEESGYSLAFNTVRRPLQVLVDGRYELPRCDTRDLPPYTASEEMRPGLIFRPT
jgi:peptidoglycan/xylan/chitin deacetylase (PgdA/CDA1 family)